MSFKMEASTSIFKIKTNSMTELAAKVGTITAYILTIIQLDIVTGILACVLTIVMSLYYFTKWQNEKLRNKLMKDGCSNNHCAIKDDE